MRGCFSFQGEKWHHAGTKYVPQPRLGQAPGCQEGERCSLCFGTVAGGVPCPGEPGAAALSPYHKAKALPTLVCPMTTLTGVTRRFRGLSTGSRYGWGRTAQARMCWHMGREAQVMSQAGLSVLIMGLGAKAASQVRHHAKGWQTWPDRANQAQGSCQGGGGGRSESVLHVLVVSVGVSGHPPSRSCRWESHLQPRDPGLSIPGSWR